MRPYLPSSPYWTPDVVAGKAKLSQEHLWGPREKWFKDAYWTNAPATFVSEMGCHGCPSYESLEKMMTKEGLYPWPDPSDPFRFNDEWCCKSTQAYPDYPKNMGHGRNSLMPRQVKTMFGSVPKDLATFVDQSQIYQAEAVKYWIEMFRSRKGRTWGIMWWNMRDGWPIISDGVVDYYYNRKRAYEAIKSVQGDQLVLLDDAHRLVAVNDALASVSGTVTATDAASGKVVFSGACEIPANGKVTLTETLPLARQGMLKIAYAFGGSPRVNHTLYGEPPFDYSSYLEWRRK
jgi:beta-mannosidase